MLENIMFAFIKWLLVCELWNLLEICYYGMLKTSREDSIISLILFYYILKSQNK